MWKQKTLKKSSKSCMKPAYTRMVSVCFIISLLTTAYPVSTTFLNLQKLSGPAYTDAAFSLSITNSEAFAETLGLILGGNAFPKLLQNTVFHVFSFVIDLCSAGISIFFNVLRTVNAFFTEPLGTSFVFLRYGLNARPPLTQREIAAQCGISRSYVSRRGYCKRGGGCLRGPGRPGRRRHPHCGVRAGKASFSEGGPECRTCGRHQHQWYSQLSGYRRYPATRSMNTLLEGLRVRCRPARVSRRLWSSSFQQSPITVRTARSTAIEVVWNCLAVSR